MNKFEKTNYPSKVGDKNHGEQWRLNAGGVKKVVGFLLGTIIKKEHEKINQEMQKLCGVKVII